MRLAFVTSLLPTGSPDTGFEIANAAVLEAFRAAGCELTLFGVLRPGETPDDRYRCIVLDTMVIENAVAGPLQKASWLLSGLTRGLPVIAAKLAPLAGKLTREMAAAGPFDACIVNSAPVAAAFPDLFKNHSCLLVAHNVEHVSARENAAAASGLNRLLYAREARLLRREEHLALERSRFVFCLAEEDRQGFGRDITDKSAVFPLLTPQPPAPPDGDPAYDVGLIGTWTWQPNLVGLRWFMDEIAPRLPRDMSLAIAGRMPAGLTTPLENLKLLGRVPDAAAFVASCRVVALTSRSGTGIQLKTIETFQMGKASVATRSSVRGFQDLPTNCLVADDPERFAAAVVKLVNDIRSERTLPADGSVFVSRQKDGMRAAVSAGLAALQHDP
jgi:Glycosyl transferases group 1